MGTVVIGIDPSSVKLAAVWAKDDGPLEAFAVSTKEPDLNNRCAFFYTQSRRLFRRVSALYPDEEIHVFMEDPVLGRGGARSTIVQSKVNGAIAAGMLLGGATKVTQVNNQQWKKSVVGKGNAGKPEIKAWSKQHWKELFAIAKNGKDQDLIDAGCIMRHGQGVIGLLIRIRRHRIEEARQAAERRNTLRRKVRR